MGKFHQLYKKLPGKIRTSLEVSGILFVLLIFVILTVAVSEGPGIGFVGFLLLCSVLVAMPYFWRQFKIWRKLVSYEKHFSQYRDHAIAKPLQGRLEAYYEQGWEGTFLEAFEPDRQPGESGAGFPLILNDGDHLTIFSEANEVLWQGVIIPGGRTGKLRGVQRARYTSWFWQSNRAELIQSSEYLSWQSEVAE